MKPRRVEWAQLVAGQLLSGLPFVILVLLVPRSAARYLPLVGLALGCGLTMIVCTLYWHWRRRPPVLRYWDDGTGFQLTIRDLRTGEVLHRAEEPHLRGRDLRDTNLEGGDLAGVDLSNADLRGANLRGANLRSANLGGARLEGADLSHARLIGAKLYNAQLRGADLSGADFLGRGLNRVVSESSLGSGIWAGAIFDGSTRWPPGFNARARGCVFRDNPESALPIPHVGDGAAERMLPRADTLRPTEELRQRQ